MEDFHDEFLSEVYKELCNKDGTVPTDVLDVAVEALQLQEVIGPDELRLELDPKEKGEIPKDTFLSVLAQYLNPTSSQEESDDEKEVVEITSEVRTAFRWFSSDNKYITRDDLIRIGKETKALPIDESTNEPKPETIDKMLSLTGNKDRLTIADLAIIMNEFAQV